MEKGSIFERIGGTPAVHATIEIFYQKTLSDDKIKGFFKNADLEKVKAHQRDFFTKIFGGPDNYKGRDMITIHKNLYITDWHFDAAKTNLLDTLEELKVPKDIIGEVDVLVEGVRKTVVFQG